ncbi:MAG: methyltransferase domain-containing protein [Deltaproteobacteria bacterium]|jgi:SAM-dependent methyltransferase|nr:methyltransferase domain-containing protein [Deltaproteobacteria bacterium]
MNLSSKNRLTVKESFLFPGDNLRDKVGRAVCEAGCLPRKELFEAWEVARRIRRRFRGGRVVDLACGHGLTAALLLLLDDTSPEAFAVDRSIPASAGKLHEILVERWPRLEGRVAFEEKSLLDVPLSSRDLVVSVHACGGLTDLILARAAEAGARVAVLPCCHNLSESDKGSLDGWIDAPMAVDITRANCLKSKGYRIYTQTIPSEITPKNRLLLAEPPQD